MSETTHEAGTRNGKNQNAKRSSSIPWYEVVKGLRAYYDHFRIAFPELEPLPRYYSDEWVEAFKQSARKFINTEDMEALRKVVEDIRLRAGAEEHRNDAAPAAATAGPAVAEPEETAQEAAPTETVEGEPAVDANVVRLVEALGDDYWQALLSDPEAFRIAIDKMLEEEPSETEGEIAPSDEEIAPSDEVSAPSDEVSAPSDEVSAPSDEVSGPSVDEEIAKKQEELEKANKDLMMESDELARSLKAAQQEVRDLKARMVDKEGELQKTATAARKAQAEIDKLKGSKDGDRDRRVAAPSELGQKLKEYEQTLAANEHRIAGLQQQVERDAQLIEELKEDLDRDRALRRKFESEMESERRDLREQIRRMGDLLAGGAEIPSLEEFEQMSGEELLEYVEDVETEKQRALASLEAIDAQEHSYQQQLHAQQEELDAVQTDLEQYKESNLATEVDGLKDTITKQRDQLESLLNFSKSLRSQNLHLKERQDPLRRIVDRLNLQEKALVRFIRLNYDRDFMPSQAFPQLGSEEASS